MGQLNEYTERKDMQGDVLCMGLANVPAGEQRSRFLAVGLEDRTVRIISLDPQVSKCYGRLCFDLPSAMYVLLVCRCGLKGRFRIYTSA